jgi:hypothetical protein
MKSANPPYDEERMKFSPRRRDGYPSIIRAGSARRADSSFSMLLIKSPRYTADYGVNGFEIFLLVGVLPGSRPIRTTGFLRCIGQHHTQLKENLQFWMSAKDPSIGEPFGAIAPVQNKAFAFKLLPANSLSGDRPPPSTSGAWYQSP